MMHREHVLEQFPQAFVKTTAEKKGGFSAYLFETARAHTENRWLACSTSPTSEEAEADVWKAAVVFVDPAGRERARPSRNFSLDAWRAEPHSSVGTAMGYPVLGLRETRLFGSTQWELEGWTEDMHEEWSAAGIARARAAHDLVLRD